MTDTNTPQTSPIQSFATAYAGLLNELSTIPQVAVLEAYKNDVVPQDTAQIANRIYQEISLPDEVTKYNLDATPQIEALNAQLAQLNEEQRVQWLQAQGVDVAAENLQETLAPKVSEWLSNPEPALEAAKTVAVVPEQATDATTKTETPEVAEDVAAAPATPATNEEPKPEQAQEPHKHDLQDSVVKYVSTVLSAAKGEEFSINRENAAALIATYSEESEKHVQVFGKHSPEHYTHDLMRIVDDFNTHDKAGQEDLILAAMISYKNASGSSITVQEAKEAMAELRTQDAVALLKHGFNASCEFLEAVATVKQARQSEVEQEQAAPAKAGFTDRIKAEKAKPVEVAVPGAA